MASTRFPMRREHYSMSLSDASEIFQTAKVTPHILCGFFVHRRGLGHAARRQGMDIVVGHMPLHRAPQRQLKRAHDLMAEFECLPLEPPIDRESETDFDVAGALAPPPTIIATGKLVST